MTPETNSFRNLQNPDWREETIQILQEVVFELGPELEPRLCDCLSPQEAIVFDQLKALSFQEGSWYRPIHNVFVSAAMLQIIENEPAPRDLLYPAMLHDVGYVDIQIAQTTTGAHWQERDKRVAHMKFGVQRARAILEDLPNSGLSESRLHKLLAIIGRHDDPYLGKPLHDHEDLLHRDADRCFVPSAVSYYKDLIAYASDVQFIEKVASMGFELSPKFFLEMRIADFYESFESLSENVSLSSLGLKTELACLTEGSACEPAYSKTGKHMLGQLLQNRQKELPHIKTLRSPADWKDFFKAACESDMQIFMI